MRTFWIAKTIHGLRIVDFEPDLLAHIGPFWTYEEAAAVLIAWVM